MHKENKRYLYLFGTAIILIFFAGILDYFYQLKIDDVSSRAKIFESRVHRVENIAEKKLQEIRSMQKQNNFADFNKLQKYSIRKGISFLVYSNDSLIKWSDNSSSFYDINKINIPDNKLIKLKNGWYEVLTLKEHEFTYYALILIKSEYYIQNRYLQNNFNPYLVPNENSGISFSESKGKFNIVSKYNKHLFSLNIQNDVNQISIDNYVLYLYIFSFIFMFIGFHLFLKQLFKKQNTYKFAFLLLLPLLRILSTYFRLPPTFYELELFSPKHYASSFFLNSLGDFLVNTLLALYIIWFLYNRFSNYKFKEFKNVIFCYATDILLFLFILFLSSGINYLISGMVINSRINFNVNNIFELSVYSYIGFIITGSLLYSFYLITDWVVLYIHLKNRPYSIRIILFLLSVSIFGITILSFHDSELFGEYDFITFLLALLLIILIQLVRLFQPAQHIFSRLSFSRTILIVFFFSAYSALSLYEFNLKKEKEHLKLLSGKLLAERDYIAEYLFEDIENKVLKDTVLSSIFTTENENDIVLKVDKRLQKLYLNSYWNKYDTRIFCFDEDGDIYPNSSEYTDNIHEFEILIESKGQSTYAKNLYFLNNSSGRISYLAILPLINNEGKKQGTILIEFASKLIHEKAGFPDLFISEKVVYNQELANYAYAIYKNNQLINQSGNYSYYLNANIFNTTNLEYETILFEEFEHFIYKPDSSIIIVISRPAEKTFTFFTLLSYFFAFYCISVFLYQTIKHFYFNGFTFNVNFKTRIQTTFMLIVFILMITIGSGTIFYVISKNKTKQKETLEDKVTALLILIENEFKDRKNFTTQFSEELEATLTKLSTNIGADFNIFNKSGTLIFSSQPKIFDAGIISEKMNPEAWSKLNLNQRTFFTQTENVGMLKYIAAYQPIRDNNNRVIAFLNMPYFARQSELNNEISSFIVALINIYALIFMLALLAVFIITNRLTKPLKIIGEKLSVTKFGNKNEPIIWDRNDEIGELVEVYNRMLDELSVSAEKLAKSERESAWREMARQVAHEIKNPLTPMKLSVQHLQKAWNDKSPQLESILDRISKTLIEQIDTLSAIAGEFSNFAQMPETQKKLVNLVEVINSTIALFEGTSQVGITFHNKTFNDAFVLADQNQLLRVFNNLIKNAVQSIPENKEGKITIHLLSRNGFYEISIIDNGIGIPHEKIPFIFSPNFTTKSAGMGLGLAMVKNIVEGSSGKIWLDTKLNQGTTFYISLPIVNV